MPLQDSDNFIVGRGTDSYKITYQDLKDDLNYVPPPVGTIDKPTVLSPSDGAGSGATRDIVTDKITAVDNTGGSYTCETDTITDVSASVSTESLYVMNTLPISLQDVFDKGTHWESGDPLSVDDYIIRVNNEGIKDSGYLFATNPTGDIGLKGGSEEGGSYDAAGNILADKVQSYTPAEWTLLAFSANAPDPNDFSIPGGYYSFYTHPSVAYQVFRLYGSGPDNDTGVTIAESVTSKTLTLASDKDLDCFEPGDVVQGVDESNTYKTYSPSNFNLPPTTLSSDWSLVEETSISAGPQASALSPIWIYEFPSSLRHVKIGY